jgi:hypothetical protein
MKYLVWLETMVLSGLNSNEPLLSTIELERRINKWGK